METKEVEITLYANKNKTITMTGRCLGLLTQGQYAKIVKDRLYSQLIKSETVALADLSRLEDVEGLRLSAELKKYDGVSITKDKLFISEPLVMISQVSHYDEIYISSENVSICVKEIVNG